MIPCNGKHKTEPWMESLCLLGIHWHGRTDGGCMGDSNQCHVCGKDSYNSIGIIVHDESKEDHEH